MQLVIEPVTEDSALGIVGWQYEGIYAFYDLVADENDLADFLDPVGWGVRYFVARNDAGALIGVFHFLMDEESGVLTIGLGMRPDLTGRGDGSAFFDAGLRWAKERFAPRRIALVVASFNVRAIRVYERAGFRHTHTFTQRTNGGEWEFVGMERAAELH